MRPPTPKRRPLTGRNDRCGGANPRGRHQSMPGAPGMFPSGLIAWRVQLGANRHHAKKLARCAQVRLLHTTEKMSSTPREIAPLTGARTSQQKLTDADYYLALRELRFMT